MINSSLHDEKTFYHQFMKDLTACQKEVIVESPFITSTRIRTIYPIFEKIVNRGIKVYIFTRDPKEHSDTWEKQSEDEIRRFERYSFVQEIIIENWQF